MSDDSLGRPRRPAGFDPRAGIARAGRRPVHYGRARRRIGRSRRRLARRARTICWCPGFIDVHVHGVEGIDTLATADAVAKLAARFPNYGVTGFCPTTVGCSPLALRRLLDGIRTARIDEPAWTRRRVSRASREQLHQPGLSGRAARALHSAAQPRGEPGVPGDVAFSGQEILDEIARARPEVGILTIAPELEGPSI